MPQFSYKSYDSLPDEAESFSDHEKLSLIICPEVVFPLRECGRDFSFDTNDFYMPYNYRLKFLYPSLYFRAAFADDGYAKLDTLMVLAKRGATIVFIVDSQKDNSLINACCFLGECFGDCRNEIEPDFTNIPFPVKKYDSPPHDWVWSCYWKKDFAERLDKEESKDFIKTISFDFPEYDSRYFPVKIIAKCEEKKGVIAFSVKVGNGKVLVVTPTIESEKCEEPAQDKIFITVNKFPVLVSLSGNDPQIEYDILYKEQPYFRRTTAISFLRLLTIYYASQDNDSFGFTISDELVWMSTRNGRILSI